MVRMTLWSYTTLTDSAVGTGCCGAMSSCGICADRFILSVTTHYEEATVTTVTKQERAHGLTRDS